MRRFELTEGASAKFWEVAREASSVTTRWGRIGTAGQTQTKPFASEDAADAALEKLVREKLGKGYAECGAAPASAEPLSQEKPSNAQPSNAQPSNAPPSKAQPSKAKATGGKDKTEELLLSYAEKFPNLFFSAVCRAHPLDEATIDELRTT